MEVKRIYPSGYCKGVALALSKVRKAVEDYPDLPVYVLGMIVHNRYIVEAFDRMGVITLQSKEKTKKELLEEIGSGVVIFTAHGSDPKLREYAAEKGLIVIDATCPDVRKNEDLIKEHLAQGYSVIYIGVRNHPEAEAVLSLNDDIHLVSDFKDIEELNIDNPLILLTNQTTMSILQTGEMIKAIQKKYPEIKTVEEICDATYRRQMAVAQEKEADTLVVVGDPVSNNTSQLVKMADAENIRRIYKVQNAQELAQYDLSECEKIAVTAGASTPDYLIRQVIAYLQTADQQHLLIDMDKIL
ncbi:MAG: 4-hydroxy-3-methylbut-2-enyl diphosphate reductase [Erysipelotrichaceae bacterium]|nr:4-hydroxy-3-methylbut-2-enyl diphosphate reductase [Erysipelotrichaceae bacterium]